MQVMCRKEIQDKDDTRGRIVMSCMETVTEGLIVSVEDTMQGHSGLL